MKRKSIIAVLLLTFIASLGIVTAFGFIGDRQAIKQAFADNDFIGWKQAHENLLTEERFQEQRDRYLGHETMRTALENGDYEAWKDAISDFKPELADKLTEEHFNKMVEKYQAIQNGDFEGHKYGSWKRKLHWG